MSKDALTILEALRDLSLEEGRIYIQQHSAEIEDVAGFGVRWKDEALRQRDIHPFTSLKLAEQLIYFGEYMHHDSSRALGLMAKGDALSAIGHEQAAMEAFDAAAEEFQRLGDEVNWARTRIGWIISCAWLGRVEEALQTAARARAIFEKHNLPYWVCVIDHNTAVIYTQAGQYQKALELYERMLTIYPTVTDMGEEWVKRAVAMVEMNQARNLAWLGDFGQAYRLLQQARESLDVLGQVNLVIKIEINLANLDYIQGYYGSALRRYYQIRDKVIQNKLNEIGMLAPIMLPMANCLVKLKRFQEACQLAAEAVDIYRRMSAAPLSIGNALYDYAATLIAAQRLKEAFAALHEAESFLSEGGFVHHATVAKLQQAELLLQMSFFREAYEQAARLKQHFEAQGLVARFTDACLIMANTLLSQFRQVDIFQEMQSSSMSREIKELCEQVADLAGQHKLREQAYKSEYLLGRLAALQGNASIAKQHYGSAIKRVEYILDNLAYDQRPAFLQSTWAVYEDMIALCLHEQQAERAFRYLEQARSLALRQYLGRGGRVQGNEDEKALQAQNAVLLRVQSELSEWQGRYRTYSALQAQSAVLLRVQSELNEWQGRYRGYRDLLDGLDAEVSADVKHEVIQEELRQCEAKINELFERLHLLQVVDDAEQTELTLEDETAENQGIDVGALREHLVPGQLLLVYFLYKGRLVIFVLTREQFVTYENPEGLEQLERLLPPLYAHLEPRGWPDPQQPPRQAVRRLLRKLYDLLIEPVKALLPAEEGLLTIVPYGPLHSLPFHALYSGERFLIEDFQVHYLPASSVLLHLSEAQRAVAGKSPLIFGHSGHGYLPRALAEAQSVAELVKGRCYQEDEATIERLMEEAEGSSLIHLATHGHCRLDAPNFSFVQLADGQLNAIDAFGLNLEGCELVTLSGCETGLALIGGGDEQLGLGRAFLAAGASALVMSLWPVEDSSTNELMRLFYERLLHGDSKVEALRAAQRHLLRHADALYTHPYFWAAFRLVGGVGPLSGVK